MFEAKASQVIDIICLGREGGPYGPHLSGSTPSRSRHFHRGHKKGRAVYRSPFLLQHTYEPLVVIFQPEVRNHLLTYHVPQCVFQLHELNEQVMLRV